MNRSVLNRTLLNTSVLCQSRLNQSGLASQRGKSGGIPAAIRQAMVLWYDIARQGCSNETMQENPVLRDLSGNGHDAICYNFGWSGMSGVGGYNMNSRKWNVYSSATHTRPNETTIHITKVAPVNDDLLIAFLTEYAASPVEKGTTFSLPPIKFKVKGVSEGELVYYVRGAIERVDIPISEGVEYYFEGGQFTASGSNVGFSIAWTKPDKTERDVDITVELLPLYPSALVSDGVDDYAYVEGLPILTKEEGYTVVAKRRILEDPATNIKDAGWINKRKTQDTGAFVIDFFNSVSKDWNTRSFSSNIPIGGSFDIDGEFIYQTSISYNGVQDLKPGDFEDTDTLYLFAALGMGAQISAAFYSLALFDRDLTAEEIEWVKTNLITA